MAKYTISFSTTLTTDRTIDADSKEEAIKIANELRFNENFFGGIVEDWNNDYEAYRAKYCTVEFEGMVEE